MNRWLRRLAFPALGLLVALILFGVKAPDAPPIQPEAGDHGESAPAFEAIVPAPVPKEGPDIVFKWRDADGNWNYADQPPPHGRWNALAIEPGRGNQPVTPDSPDPADGDLAAPYSAPFSLRNFYPESGS